MRSCGLRIALCVAVALLVLGGLPERGAALADGWTQSFYALACQADPGVVPLRDAPFPPAGCAPIPHAILALESLEGYLIASCLMDQGYWCTMSGEPNVPYRVALVSGDVLDGFVARDNPALYERESSIGTGVVYLPAAAIPDATATARVTIHARACPTGYEGSDFFDDCHGNPPPFSQLFQANGPTMWSATTDAHGDATFAHLAPGGLGNLDAAADRRHLPLRLLLRRRFAGRRVRARLDRIGTDASRAPARHNPRRR